MDGWNRVRRLQYFEKLGEETVRWDLENKRHRYIGTSADEALLARQWLIDMDRRRSDAAALDRRLAWLKWGAGSLFLMIVLLIYDL
jgi:hypothetical protein